MNFESVKTWFEQANARRVRNFRLKGLLGFALGPFALAAAFGLIFVLVFALNHHDGEPDHPATAFWIALVVVPLMFLGNKFLPRMDTMEDVMSEGPSFRSRYRGRLQIFLWIMFAGPRLFNWAFGSLGKAKRLQQLDTHSCAAVLWALATNPRKVPLEDMQRTVPWLNLEAALPEVRLIPGVLEFQTPPPGLGLTPELREAIRVGGAIEEK